MNLSSRGEVVRLLALSVLITAHARADEKELEGFDADVEKAMKDWRVPGVAVAVVADDRVVFARGYGVRRAGTDSKVDKHTLFAIGSTSKAFTAAAIALLVEDGKVKWDDPVTLHLPGFQLFDPYTTREIRVRDLLCHRSGLPRGDLVWYGTDYDRDEILRRVRSLRPNTSFRSRYGYQNIMFLAAGQIVPVHTGKSWDQFVRERFFEPLGMKRTNTSVRDLKDDENVATPHVWFGDELHVVPYRNIDNIAPAGSINSCVIELSQWIRLQLGRGEFKGRRLIDDEAVELMHSPQVVIPSLGSWRKRTRNASNFLTYGLGWTIFDYHGEKILSHGGAIDGMRANVTLVPRKKRGFVILSNQSGHTQVPTALQLTLLDRLLGRDAADWSGRFLKRYRKDRAKREKETQERKDSRVEGTKPRLPLESYAGIYTHAFYGPISVVKEGEKLVMRRGLAVFDMDHWHFDSFQLVQQGPLRRKSLVTFVIGADGKVRKAALGEDEFIRVRKKKKAGSK